ncbi:glycosyltransferase [Actinomadura kijaniata]|uniref:UDP:flavonoid glycosyltransferase YjiC (YdhE family) n=1 Tax=Actinomadura namibiensis TaxID=182080 RepID=A0A7W3LM63_ACTNM|nr:glycosyltransferase [Actinomadura namibiensis]MBA8950716.1 UDP:flavonoid glycosyltransferase YjiC (YdhE family) [Actinomadura namibiensis]
MTRTIVIFAAGSRGDIQPCAALGRALRERGDRVRLVASARYAPLAHRAGLELAPLTADPAEIMNSPEGQRLLASGRNPVRFLTGFWRILGPLAERLLAECLDACKGADLILGPTLGLLPVHIGEHLGVPWALIHFQPSQPTGAFPHPFVPRLPALGPWANRATYAAVEQLTWQLSRPFINPWRTGPLGLRRAPLRGLTREVQRTGPVLACFSEAVVPRPRDWGAHVNLTGYWFLDEPGWEPPDDLAAFLEAGPPPVYVGFGSMVPRDARGTDRTVRAALRAAGVRGVVQGDPATSDDDVLAVSDVPHSWLFPRMAAVVHHGGAGTTAAGLRAGVPTVVCPFFGDQPYWGDRVHALGAGPEPLPFRRLTVPLLAARVRRATNDAGFAGGARAVSDRLHAEDGVARAAEVLDALR